MMGSSTCDAIELLREKIRNLEPMMMGCQQDVVVLEGSIEQEEQALELRRNGTEVAIACMQEKNVILTSIILLLAFESGSARASIDGAKFRAQHKLREHACMCFN